MLVASIVTRGVIMSGKIIVSWVPFFTKTYYYISSFFDEFSSKILQVILDAFQWYSIFVTKSHGFQQCASTTCTPPISNPMPRKESSVLRSCMKVATLDNSLASCACSDDENKSFPLNSIFHGKRQRRHSSPAIICTPHNERGEVHHPTNWNRQLKV